MIRAKNYEKLFKFVKVTANIMSVLLRGHGVYSKGGILLQLIVCQILTELSCTCAAQVGNVVNGVSRTNRGYSRTPAMFVGRIKNTAGRLLAVTRRPTVERHEIKIPDGDIPSQKYRNNGVPRYFVT